MAKLELKIIKKAIIIIKMLAHFKPLIIWKENILPYACIRNIIWLEPVSTRLQTIFGRNYLDKDVNMEGYRNMCLKKIINIFTVVRPRKKASKKASSEAVLVSSLLDNDQSNSGVGADCEAATSPR